MNFSLLTAGVISYPRVTVQKDDPNCHTLPRSAQLLCVWALSCLCLLGFPPTEGAEPQAEPLDFTDLSLEALLQAELTPINVLGSHTHLQDQWMAGYRYMFMRMAGNLDGTRTVSSGEVLAQFPLVHTEMTMEMHMVELMYAPTDNFTLMGMLPYQRNWMDHRKRNGETFTSRSEGIGDFQFMALYNLLGDVRRKGHRLVLNAGISFPTGSVKEKSGGAKLEYPMQLGSGTFDLNPGVTYLGESDNWAWGAQALGTLRLGRNDEGYSLGDRYQLGSWAHFKVTDWFGPSIRLEWQSWENVNGRDQDLNAARNPAFDPNKQEGKRLDFLVGLNYYVSKGPFRGNRLSVEGGAPVYQSLAGPDLKTDWLISAAWSYTF